TAGRNLLPLVISTAGRNLPTAGALPRFLPAVEMTGDVGDGTRRFGGLAVWRFGGLAVWREGGRAGGRPATGDRRRAHAGGVGCYSAAAGAAIDLLYMPERSKQQARRWPEASLSQAVAMRLIRVSAFLPEMIQWIQSRRATAVMSSQVARATGCS